ncbi:TIGR04282 family arsenosugar biosynthesis glycosyltransferase [Allorhodopirellula solitaria]|uniref:2-phospho-L-lactate guanylyltransferase n=1 Tax=Allorhodopirellula solitaria TaxID=2527987 RepID=A0A5C5XTU0_9BACT|nr:TIGR04282 family arsenosugar biosynthesis glycosyltransferase [Allorhodopirellula solitaria]TWT66350.1 2-phospho-L-lactate guanylyltransferase [Allorhodopirellula solitaria]
MRTRSVSEAPAGASRLIVFTRYPEAGKTKTRMIPALGPEGAAELQVALTRHALRVAADYCAQNAGEWEVRFAGGDAVKMGQCFGADHDYRPQAGGDLGRRLAQAVAAAFDEHARRVVVIGADCPALHAGLLGQAMRALRDSDVVLGPAVDGGYYLIGMRQDQPQLFRGIDWGSDRVREQTLCKAKQSQLRVHCLRPLSDVDRPEDLSLCERYLSGYRAAKK